MKRALLIACLLAAAPAAAQDESAPEAPVEEVVTETEDVAPESPDAEEAPAEPPAPEAPPAEVAAPPAPEPPPTPAEPLPKATKPRVAIMNLAPAAGVSDDLTLGLTGLVATRIDGLRIFDVVTEDDVRALIDFDEMRTVLSESEDASKLADIGEALGADYLISGRAYAEPRVDLVLFDLKTQKAVRREVAEARTRAALTRPLLRKVDRVIAPVLAARTARLIVRSSEEGATISLDGDALGTSPLPVREIGSGPHTLTATKDGFIKSEFDLVLQPGQSIPVDVVLVPSQELVEQHEKDAWLWRGTSLGLLGGAVASVGVGAGFLIANELRTEALADQTDQKEAAVLQLRPSEYNELQLYRITGGILLAGVAPVLAAGGAFAWYAGPEPGKYDELTE
jgi:hypothetical protein